MKIKNFILSTMLLLIGGQAAANDHPAFMPVKDLFAAMSAFDGKAMKATSTDDFQLLEHGEDWTMQMLVDAVMPKGKPYVRKNYFQQIRAVENGNSVWISYWNKAEISGENGRGEVVWLESAVMVKVDGKWKIQMLHSTRLDKERYPKNVKWIEFKGNASR